MPEFVALSHAVIILPISALFYKTCLTLIIKPALHVISAIIIFVSLMKFDMNL